jgi:mannose-1-phosphate guanylyltransferase/phosphomannomutase
MKAVIMAGGEGTRLRPLSLGRPKPMTTLFDRPVMEHIIGLLKRCGHHRDLRDAAVYAERWKNFSGDGSGLGVSLKYFEEETPWHRGQR